MLSGLQVCVDVLHLVGGDMINTNKSTETVFEAGKEFGPNAGRTELHVGVTGMQLTARRVKRKLNLREVCHLSLTLSLLSPWRL
jgi:hypothetical protein